MSIPQKSLFSLLLLTCAKNCYNRSKFDKVLTKNKLAQFFFRHGVFALSDFWGYLCNLYCRPAIPPQFLARSLQLVEVRLYDFTPKKKFWKVTGLILPLAMRYQHAVVQAAATEMASIREIGSFGTSLMLHRSMAYFVLLCVYCNNNNNNNNCFCCLRNISSRHLCRD